MKRFISSFFVLALLVCSTYLPIEAKAEELDEKTSIEWGSKTLSKKQVKFLKNEVGLTEEEIEVLPAHILEELIDNNAKKLARNHKEKKFESNDGQFNTSSVGKRVDGGYIKLDAIAFEVDSDKSGKKKFYFYGGYNWTESPGWELIDALSLGWPDSAEIVLPMTSGKVDQHETRYCEKPDNNASAPWDCSTDRSPEDWDNGMGVGNRFNIDGAPNNNIHKGYIAQYVYTARNSGYVNVKFEYGHQEFDWGDPSFSVFPAGLSIDPDTVDEIIDYGLEFEW